MLFVVLAVFLLSGTLAFAQEDIHKHPSCPLCGMDRAKFSQSRMLIEYEDGTSFGACSLHCAAVELATNVDKTPKMIWVADYNSKRLIDAEKAVWIIGGSKSGVMTRYVSRYQDDP
jgi:nitrous oxide reductase accessory protein NosL